MQDKSLGVLKEFWGYDSFRPLQKEIIDSVLKKQDTLALLPTGGGKSVCFQVPALQMEGVCIVVSPLIALMQDQVSSLKKKKIPVEVLHSGMSKREVDIALDNCLYGNIKFLYLSPERLQSPWAREKIAHMNVRIIAVDEAHCISEWGYDFRPSYLNITELRDMHPHATVIALTASATDRVADDIQDKLNFTTKHVLKASFARENIAFMTLKEGDKMSRLIRVLEWAKGTCIVYVGSRREAQEVALFILQHGISAGYYHAGVSQKEKNQFFEQWMRSEIRVMVATNAFGMGIDKASVRAVVHLYIPDSLETYYQQAGRAGRDGNKAYSVTLYNDKDVELLKDNFEKQFPAIDLVKKVYHFLGSYYQIAYESGALMSFDFDIRDFSKKYRIDPLEAYHSLKVLEREALLQISDAVFVPSRVRIEIDYNELYSFQVAHKLYDPLIKLLLRAEGGVFDHYSVVHEKMLAKQLGVEPREIQKRLHELHRLEVLDYIPASSMPTVVFLQDRIHTDLLHLDGASEKRRKEQKEDQLRAVFDYLNEKQCRVKALLNYFGERLTQDCGNCDLCRIRKQEQNSANS